MTLAALVELTGTAVIGMLSVGFFLMVAAWLIDLLHNRIVRRLARTYDLLVVEYWIRVANENGRRIPRRADIEARLREQETS